MSTGQLFTWRRQAREGKLATADAGVAFVPAVITEGAPVLAGPDSGGGVARPTAQAGTLTPATGRMEIVLADARRIIVGNDVDTSALGRVIAALERR
jgi:transposase